MVVVALITTMASLQHRDLNVASFVPLLVFSALVYCMATGRNWARLLYAVLAGVSIVATVVVVSIGISNGLGSEALVALMLIGVHVVVLTLLFMPVSSAWFVARSVGGGSSITS
jgi:hypothetical protein